MSDSDKHKYKYLVIIYLQFAINASFDFDLMISFIKIIHCFSDICERFSTMINFPDKKLFLLLNEVQNFNNNGVWNICFMVREMELTFFCLKTDMKL